MEERTEEGREESPCTCPICLLARGTNRVNPAHTDRRTLGSAMLGMKTILDSIPSLLDTMFGMIPEEKRGGPSGEVEEMLEEIKRKIRGYEIVYDDVDVVKNVFSERFAAWVMNCHMQGLSEAYITGVVKEGGVDVTLHEKNGIQMIAIIEDDDTYQHMLEHHRLQLAMVKMPVVDIVQYVGDILNEDDDTDDLGAIEIWRPTVDGCAIPYIMAMDPESMDRSEKANNYVQSQMDTRDLATMFVDSLSPSENGGINFIEALSAIGFNVIDGSSLMREVGEEAEEGREVGTEAADDKVNNKKPGSGRVLH